MHANPRRRPVGRWLVAVLLLAAAAGLAVACGGGDDGAASVPGDVPVARTRLGPADAPVQVVHWADFQ